MPDDAKDIRKHTSVIRWDSKKKKYLPVMVSVDGRAVKKQRHLNEAGVYVDGEAQKTTIYAKWARNSKRRIQKVGELEQGFHKPGSRKWGADTENQLAKAKARAKPDTIAFDNTGKYSRDGDEDKGRKPIVPYHGKIEEKYLTHKQKR